MENYSKISNCSLNVIVSSRHRYFLNGINSLRHFVGYNVNVLDDIMNHFLTFSFHFLLRLCVGYCRKYRIMGSTYNNIQSACFKLILLNFVFR